MARQVDHGEQQIADLGRRLCRSSRRLISASISSTSSRILASTASGSFQSKPTLPALACSLSARVSAGRATGTPASALVRSGGEAARRLFLGLDAVPQHLHLVRRRALRLAEHVRMAAQQLLGDRRDDVAEVERALLLRHTGMEHDLEQQVAQLLAQVRQSRCARWRRRPRRLPRACRARSSRNSARDPTDSRSRACAAPP